MAWKRQSKEEKERLHRRRRRQLLGGVLSVLIVVGALSIAAATTTGVAKLFDNTKEKAAYESLLSPLVMLDPVPFSTLEVADQNLLVQAAIWQTIYNEDITKYERDDIGALMLPSIDINKNAALTYGKDYQMVHKTFESSGMQFTYNEETQAYTIPITGTTGSYTPKVTDIKNSIKEKIVTVGYIEPQPGFSVDGAPTIDANEPVKYYDYVFSRQDDGYFLTAITESETVPYIDKGNGNSASSSTINDMDEFLNAQSETVKD